MSLLRPAVRAGMHRWREVIAAAGAALAGLWLIGLGGWLLVPVGAVVVAAALGWGLVALRRLRFARAVSAPGVVEVDEGQIGYFGPTFGGGVALDEIQEIRLTVFHGAGQWRLRTLDGQVLLIPVAAAGAERLYDAFAALPGADTARIAAALARGVTTLPLWQRPPAGAAGRPADHKLS